MDAILLKGDNYTNDSIDEFILKNTILKYGDLIDDFYNPYNKLDELAKYIKREFKVESYAIDKYYYINKLILTDDKNIIEIYFKRTIKQINHNLTDNSGVKQIIVNTQKLVLDSNFNFENKKEEKLTYTAYTNDTPIINFSPNDLHIFLNRLTTIVLNHLQLIENELKQKN